MEVRRIGRPSCAALLASVVLASGPAGAQTSAFVGSDLMEVLERSGPPPVILAEPAIVTDRTRRQVVTDTCEDIGEAKLRRLAQTATVEEAFALLPQSCTWIDVGVDQTATSVRVERRIVDELAEAYGHVVLYHLHPRAADRDRRYLPAFSDLLAVVLINSRYAHDDGVQILHRAITPDTVFEYSFEPTGVGRERLGQIFRTGLGPFAGENLLPTYAAPDQERHYYEAVGECPAPGDAAGGAANSCFPLRTGDFVLLRRTPGLGNAGLATH